MLTLTSLALARTWVVDLDGCGDFRTIEEAFVAVSDGDTIRIRPGVHHLSAGVYTYADAVSIEGADRDTTIIDGVDGPPGGMLLQSNNTLKNITFRDFRNGGAPLSLQAPTDDGGLITVENVKIENAYPHEGDDDLTGAIWIKGNVDVILRNVKISGYDMSVVPYIWTRSLVVENSIFQSRYHGIFTLNTSNGFCGESIVIDHSLFLGGRDGIGLASHDDYVCEHPVATITNNIFAGFSEFPFGASSGIIGFADNNLVLGPEVEIEPYDLAITNTIFVDSGFVAWSDDGDYTNDDVHLVPGSAAVDAAVDWVVPSATDAEGRPRPIDGDGDGELTNDIGPYELDPRDPGAYDDGVEPVDTGDCVETGDTGEADDTADTAAPDDSASEDTVAGDSDKSTGTGDTGALTADGCGCEALAGARVGWALLGVSAVWASRRERGSARAVTGPPQR